MPFSIIVHAVLLALVVAVPVLAGAWQRRELWRGLASLPAFFVMRTVNAVFFLRAIWSELVMHRSFNTYEKGH